MKVWSRCLAIFLLVVSPIRAQQLAPSDDYVIGPRDVIEIRVEQDHSLDTVARVGASGRIAMSLLNEVEVAGLTTIEVASRIRTLLEKKFMNKAEVSVVVREFESQPVSVFGAVGRPGKLPITGEMNLIQAISSAGGLNSAGGARNIYVIRNSKNGLTAQIMIDAEELMIDGNPDLNIPLYPNDIINVQADRKISVYFLGQVSKPGVVEFRESQQPTLLKALAYAGGLTDRAKASGITIKRVENRKEVTIRVSYTDILKGRAPDIALKDDDTIIIKESFW